MTTMRVDPIAYRAVVLKTGMRDPCGHSWLFATRVEPMTVESTREAAARARL